MQFHQSIDRTMGFGPKMDILIAIEEEEEEHKCQEEGEEKVGKGKEEREKGNGKEEREKGNGKEETEKGNGKEETEKVKGKEETEKVKEKEETEKGKRKGRNRRGKRNRKGPRAKKEKRRTGKGGGNGDGCSSMASEFIAMVNEYRESNGLEAVPANSCLCQTCDEKTDQLRQGLTQEHDWADCKLLQDWECVRNKPNEICGYSGKGYENYAWSQMGETPKNAFRQWKNSPGHNALMLNQKHWASKQFKGMGASFDGEYAVMLMGD